MMDLQDFETRHLITKGLNQIQNDFLKKMVEKNAYVMKDGVTPTSISFYVAPYVNAINRTGTMYEKNLLFSSMLNFLSDKMIGSTKRGHKGEEELLVEQAIRTCTNVKNRQTRLRDEFFDKIEKIIEEKELLKNKVLLVTLDDRYDFNRGLTGLIANQLMAKYMRPTLLLHKNGDAWSGSGRGLNQSELDDFNSFLTESGLFNFVEGHAQAFGASIDDDKIDEFISWSNEKLKDMDFSIKYNVDFIFNSTDFDPNVIYEIDHLKDLWGQNIEECLIAITGLEIDRYSITLMSQDKNPTLKIVLPNGTELIKFKSSMEEYKSLLPPSSQRYIIDIIGKCAVNEWQGRTTPQILIEDYEITNVKYDF